MTSPLSLPFDTLDVFTTTRYRGNPLAIVHLPSSAQPTTTSTQPTQPSGTQPARQAITQDQKQAIAREFNLSETVILHENPGDAFDRKVDIFIPEAEIPFAGHPTIGTLCHIGAATKTASESQAINLHVKAGLIRGSYNAKTGRARASIPHDVHFSGLATASEACHESASNAYPTRDAVASLPYPVVSPVKGMSFMLVELDSAEALSSCRVSMLTDLATVYEQKTRDEVKPTLLATYFWTFIGRDKAASKVVRIDTRMMMNGIPPEDPATGSAACTLASALSTWRRRSDDALAGVLPDASNAALGHRPACLEELRVGEQDLIDRYEIIQGRDMGRESNIVVEVRMKADGTGIKEVILEGQAVPVMRGSLLI